MATLGANQDQVDALDQRFFQNLFFDVFRERQVAEGLHAGFGCLVDGTLQLGLHFFLQFLLKAAPTSGGTVVPNQVERRRSVNDRQQQQLRTQLRRQANGVAEFGLAGLREIDRRKDALHNRCHHDAILRGDASISRVRPVSCPANYSPRTNSLDLKDLKIERQPTKKRRRNNPWPIRIGVIAVLGGAAWLIWPMASDFFDQVRLPQVRTFLVKEAAPSAAAAVRGTAANGYVVAARRAALSSDVPGRIVELNVTEGSVVKQGDIVARLFSDEYRAAWQQTEANLAVAAAGVTRATANVAVANASVTEARSSLSMAEALRDEGATQLDYAVQERDRVAQLTTTGIEGIRRQQQADRDFAAATARLASLVASMETSSAQVATATQRANVAVAEVEVAKNQENAAKAARDQAKATLDKTDVRAPFDGIVVLKDAEVGEVVSPNVQGGGNARGAVCTMVDFDSLEVQANVPESALASVRIGAPADVFLEAFPDDRYAGTVDRIWPTADRQKGTVEVRVRFEQRDDRLRPEMGVRVVFRAADEPEPIAQGESTVRSIIIPAEALVQVAGKTGAFLVERDTVRFTEVTAGNRKSGRVAIDAGLTANQRIVISPPSSLRDGDRIRVEAQ